MMMNLMTHEQKTFTDEACEMHLKLWKKLVSGTWIMIILSNCSYQGHEWTFTLKVNELSL